VNGSEIVELLFIQSLVPLYNLNARGFEAEGLHEGRDKFLELLLGEVNFEGLKGDVYKVLFL